MTALGIGESPAAFGRLCVETGLVFFSMRLLAPAAFGRLCVETAISDQFFITSNQPPSGGCVLKQAETEWYDQSKIQPPSGGCVLKPEACGQGRVWQAPAAFGRLCVETGVAYVINVCDPPAAFGRLCVETRLHLINGRGACHQPPSGGCVLKL